MADKTEILEALENAVSEAFETMAFAEVMGKEELNELPGWIDNSIWASMAIENPIKTTCHFIVQKEQAMGMVELIAETDDEEELEKLMYDTASEYINTIGGRLGLALLPEGEKVIVGLPEIVELNEETKEDMKNKIDLIVSFNVEEQEVLCCLEKTG
ncbi:MAG: chemotaxis protein CheX [bacterium]|nr:chemotaxis protein CheX [bacterium]